MTRARRRRARPQPLEGSPDVVLAVEHTRSHNRSTGRDRLRWDRELWEAYVRTDRFDPDAPPRDDAA